MRLGIIGLPQSGKTTLFNAVTRGSRVVHNQRDAVSMRRVREPLDVEHVEASFAAEETIFASAMP